MTAVTGLSKLKCDATTRENIEHWLNGPYDEQTKDKIRQMVKTNPQGLIDAFYTNLSFGTGGLRGIMGVGTNRMNIYTVKSATQGLANYLLKQPKQGNKPLSVFIGYDSRHNSKTFAEECARVLAGNNIHVYLLKELRPTPLVSFGCRFYECSAGIMITASHNPPQYNGYKVYWNDGGQVLPPHDVGIIAEVNAINDPSMIKEGSIHSPLITHVKEIVDQAYLQLASSLALWPKEDKAKGSQLKIVYTSLHGTGVTIVPQTLAHWGFTHLIYVEEQRTPDGNFPTIKAPNPEDSATLKLGIDLLQRSRGDILLATDGDADRVGIAINHRGKSIILDGNQIACLALYHILNSIETQKKKLERGAFIKTIVTTELFKIIAEDHGYKCFDVLTGFKYIAEKIRQWERDSEGFRYIFGGEESYGYLLGTYTRDKDAATACALLAEMALQAKLNGKTLYDILSEIYQKYGAFHEKLHYINFGSSKEDLEKMQRLMEQLRSKPPVVLGGIAIESLEDYERSIKIDKTGKKTQLALPKSNVLLFWMEDGSKVVIRPSGTEPKIKIYVGVTKKITSNLDETLAACEARAKLLIGSLEELLK